jgi:hypothetical protein
MEFSVGKIVKKEIKSASKRESKIDKRKSNINQPQLCYG